MSETNIQMMCSVAATPRVSAALLGFARQKGLGAALPHADQKVELDPGCSGEGVQGRSLPRSPRVIEAWVGVLIAAACDTRRAVYGGAIAFPAACMPVRSLRLMAGHNA